MQLPEGLPVDTVLLILYHYVPSRPAAIAAVVLYAVISILVAGISIKTRSYFMLTVAVTGFLELAGREVWTLCVGWVSRVRGGGQAAQGESTAAFCWCQLHGCRAQRLHVLRVANKAAILGCMVDSICLHPLHSCMVSCHGSWQLDPNYSSAAAAVGHSQATVLPAMLQL